MELREAIEHARAVAEGCPAGDRDCAYQHDKLVGWLEELERLHEVLGDDYNLDRLKELVEADKAGRFVIPYEPNCLKCHYRHEDNGNCTATGGFCTAVPAAHCPLIPELFARIKMEKAKVKVAESAFTERNRSAENKKTPANETVGLKNT